MLGDPLGLRFPGLTFLLTMRLVIPKTATTVQQIPQCRLCPWFTRWSWFSFDQFPSRLPFFAITSAAGFLSALPMPVQIMPLAPVRVTFEAPLELASAEYAPGSVPKLRLTQSRLVAPSHLSLPPRFVSRC